MLAHPKDRCRRDFDVPGGTFVAARVGLWEFLNSRCIRGNREELCWVACHSCQSVELSQGGFRQGHLIEVETKSW
jgi:hypothetical protein